MKAVARRSRYVVIAIVVVALVFDYINGFHDAANSIATVVSTRVLTPREAVLWAAFFNFIAFVVFPLHVAHTIGKGIIDPHDHRRRRARRRAGRRHRLEPDHLVVRAAVELVARAGGRPDRRRRLQGRASVILGSRRHQDGAVHRAVAGARHAARRRHDGAGRVDAAGASTPGKVDRWFRRLQLLSAALFSLGHGAQRRAEDHGHHHGAADRQGLPEPTSRRCRCG